MAEKLQVFNAVNSLRVINLTQLPAYKKPAIWMQIKQQNPALAKLLKSKAFNDFKQQLESRFGAVDISVDPRDIGGTENGISCISQKQY